MNFPRLAVWTVLFSFCATARGEDWPQWLGPQRDSVWAETGILTEVPAGGLNVQWRVPVAGGYAGPVVANGRVFVTDFVPRDGVPANDPNARTTAAGRERVLCLSEDSGEKIWEVSYDVTYEISYPQGPRCSPTVDGDRVYALGAQGKLLCLNAATGEIHWQKDFVADLKSEPPMWGYAAHPLVYGDLLICIVGAPDKLAVAFDKLTGEERWGTLGGHAAGYAPPTLLTLAGQEQLILWDADELHAVRPATGEKLWTQPLAAQYGMSSMTPRVSGDVLFASAIGNAGGAFRVFADRVEPLWGGDPKLGVYCAISSPIIENGTLYGVDCQVGCLRGIDLATGNRLWETFAPTSGGTRRTSHGNAFLVKQGSQYLLFSETGDLVFVELTPEKYTERGRFHLLDPTTEALGRNVVWSHPAFANGCCFARNDKELVKVSLRAGR